MLTCIRDVISDPEPAGCVAGSLRDELARVLTGASPLGFVREEIVASWRQSAALGIRPHECDPHYDGDIDDQTAMLRAARPVFDRLGGDLASTNVSVVLSDDRTRVVAQRAPNGIERRRIDDVALSPGFGWGLGSAGTNAIAIASAVRSPMLVNGDEHFLDAVCTLTTASSPVRDPRTAQILGALTLVCTAKSANSLLLPVARRAAREVEQRLLDGSSARERLLDEHFLRARRHARGPLVLVAKNTLLMNAAAARLMTPADQPRLWAVASQVLDKGHGNTAMFAPAEGSALVATVEPVSDGLEIAGALIRMHSTNERQSGSAPRSAYGWSSLTETEHALAELVAEGMTNREAAARLFLSHHTVDAHLRHIYRKLDINSRVELTRVVTARSARRDADLRLAV